MITVPCAWQHVYKKALVSPSPDIHLFLLLSGVQKGVLSLFYIIQYTSDP